MTRANSGLMCFISVFVIGATVFSGVKAENISAVVPGTGSDTSSDTARHEVDTVMQKFAVYKNNQTEELAAKLDLKIPDEFQHFSKSIQANASWADVSNQFAKLENRSGQHQTGTNDPLISTLLWAGPIMELGGAYEMVKAREPGLVTLYANSILNGLPDGSILMGGTDAGRFISTAFRYGRGTPNIYIITQNALCAGNYAQYIRTIYGQDIKLPTQYDCKKAMKIYGDQVTSQMLPKEGEVKVKTNGEYTIQGVGAVMGVNGILARQIYDANKQDRPIFVEESHVIEWMYPYLEPAGVIMRLRPEKVVLTDAIIADNTRYWDALCRDLLGRADSKRDVMKAKADQSTQYLVPAFAKARVAQASLYAFHHKFDLAEAAFRQAIALYPISPEANFRLLDMYMAQGKEDQAREVLARYMALMPKTEETKRHVKQTLEWMKYLNDFKTRKESMETNKARKADSPPAPATTSP